MGAQRVLDRRCGGFLVVRYEVAHPARTPSGAGCGPASLIPVRVKADEQLLSLSVRVSGVLHRSGWVTSHCPKVFVRGANALVAAKSA
jgi:hypothetical protein